MLYRLEFLEAVGFRAGGSGLVPIETIRLLTQEEWRDIRLMNRIQAQKLLSEIGNSWLGEAGGVALSRTTTPTMDEGTLAKLRGA